MQQYSSIVLVAKKPINTNYTDLTKKLRHILKLISLKLMIES